MTELERLIDRFEEAWQQGQRPRLDDYLPAQGEQRLAVLVELVHVDLERRFQDGRGASIAEYLERYPELAAHESIVVQLREAEEELHRTHTAGGTNGQAGVSSCQDPLATLPEAPSEHVAPLGRGGYEILEKLGEGSMGVVFKARDVRLGRLVALKWIRLGDGANPEALVRFAAEARAHACLQHPHIVQIYEVDEADGQPYLALEYVEGGSLEKCLRDGALPPVKAANLLWTLALAIHHAHQQHIIHRDLKPANILLQPNGTPKISDFGLAKRIDEASQTATGSVMGTPAYMAPEQAAGLSKQIGPAADVYALGAILYECLTGRPPFKGASILETLDQVRSQEPVAPSQLQPKLPRDLETICLKCLAKEPHKRYATADDLADDLGRFLQGRPIRARPAPTWERVARWARRRPAVASLLALVCLVTVAGIGAVTWQWRQTAAGLAKAEQNLYAQRIALADREYLANRCDQTERILKECPPPLRGWEWHLLKRLCHRDLLTVALDTPLGVAYSPADPTATGEHPSVLAASTARGEVVLLDPASGKVLRTFAGAGPAVAFSPDGRLLASAVWKLGDFGELPREYDCPVKVWETASGKEVQSLAGYRGTVFGLAFSPNGRRIASASLDGTVKVWDLPEQGSGKLRHTLRGHTGWVEAVAFSPNGERLASAATDNTVKVWDPNSGLELRTLRDQGFSMSSRGLVTSNKGTPPGSGEMDRTGLARQLKIWNAASNQTILPLRGQMHSVASVCFAPDGRLAAGRGSVIKVWDIEKEVELATLRGHSDLVRCLQFHPTANRLVSGGYDRSVRLWDLKTGEEIATFRGHADAVNGVAFAPGGGQLASVSWDGTVRLWDTEHGGEVLTLRGHTDYVRGLAFSPDGASLVTASADHTIRQWEPATGRLLQTRNGHRDEVNGVAFSRSGLLASVGYDGLIQLWQPDQEKPLRTLRGHTGKVYHAAFHPLDDRLASAGDDGTIRLWNTGTGEEITTLHSPDGRVFSVCFAPGEWLASAGDGGPIRIWDLATGKERLVLRGHDGDVTRLALSRDGRLLASSSLDGTVRLWDPRSGREIRVLAGHTSAVTAVAFSVDGKRVATAGLDRTVRLWDSGTGQELLSLRSHGGEVLSLEFSPDGWRLAASTVEGTVHIWDASPLSGR